MIATPLLHQTTKMRYQFSSCLLCSKRRAAPLTSMIKNIQKILKVVDPPPHLPIFIVFQSCPKYACQFIRTKIYWIQKYGLLIMRASLLWPTFIGTYLQLSWKCQRHFINILTKDQNIINFCKWCCDVTSIFGETTYTKSTRGCFWALCSKRYKKTKRKYTFKNIHLLHLSLALLRLFQHVFDIFCVCYVCHF